MVSKPGGANTLGAGGFKATAPVTTGPASSTGVSSWLMPTPNGTESQTSSSKPDAPTDEADEELDLLLGLQKPVTELSLTDSKPSSTAEDVTPVCEQSEYGRVSQNHFQRSINLYSVFDLWSFFVKAAEEKETVETVEVPKEKEAPPKPVPAKQEVTEEDLEDWLDSMIS